MTSGKMSYKQASEVRKSGVLQQVSSRLLGGQSLGKSIKSSISSNLLAQSKGFKEQFDPLKMASSIGGPAGTALMGKLTGRSEEDIEYFMQQSGRKRNPFFVSEEDDDIDGEKKSGKKETLYESLGKLYNMFKKVLNSDKQDQRNTLSKSKANLNLMNSRHEEIVKVLKSLSGEKTEEVKRKIEEKQTEQKLTEEKPKPKKRTVRGKRSKRGKRVPGKKPSATKTTRKSDADVAQPGKTGATPKAPTPKTPPSPAPTPKAPTASPAGTSGAGRTAGVAIVGGASLYSKVASAESAGNNPDSYLLMNKANAEVGKNSNLIKRGAIDITTGKPFEKDLTEMTMGEVFDLGMRRRNYFKQSGAGAAAGKYQFMPATLEGFAKRAFGDNWRNEKYSAENQELLMKNLTEGNAAALKRAGVPVTDAALYLVHFSGNAQYAKKVLTAPDETSMASFMSPAVINANPSVARMTVGQYKSYLAKKGFDFKEVDLKEIDKTKPEGVSPTAVPPTPVQTDKNTGKVLNKESVDNKQTATGKIETSVNVVNTTVVNNNKKTVVPTGQRDNKSHMQRAQEQ
jgi:hypothetical protein